MGDPKGILSVDETGFLKKGTASARVARQYSGTAGRVENCQIGVFPTYATPAGRTFLDRELCLAKAWMDDPVRCKRAGSTAERVMASTQDCAADWKPGACTASRPCPMNQHAIARARGSVGGEGRADEHFAALDKRAWRTRTAGTGTKGERRYAWARIRINGPAETGERWLLARRYLKDPMDLAHFICHTPENVTLIEPARVAGARWAIEETFQTSKGETGLDHYQVRQYSGWYRHITLSMFAQAFLSVTRPKKGGPHPGTEHLVRLSLPEIRHLITRIIWYREPDVHHVIHCSPWRRQHQYRAQQCHYKARGHTPQTRL